MKNWVQRARVEPGGLQDEARVLWVPSGPMAAGVRADVEAAMR